MENKSLINGKRRARKLVLQALYQWLMSGAELIEIELQFRAANNMDKVDAVYFCRLLYGVPEYLSILETHFAPLLDRPMSQLNPIELTLLRLSSFELCYCQEIPYRVVLNESVSLAKQYGSQDGYKYVNGILNRMAKQVRTLEINLESK